MNKPDILEEKHKQEERDINSAPTIITGVAEYNRHGKVSRINLTELTENMLIERCGKLYRVSKNGTQTFVGFTGANK